MHEVALTRKQIWQLTLLTAFVGLALLAWVGSAWSALDPKAASNSKPGQTGAVSPADAIQIEHRRVQYAGDIWMCVSNDGKLGTNSGDVLPDARDLQDLRITYGPSFEFPAGSRIDFLFNGSLWIGGIVGPDTLVSMAVNSGSGDALEWNGHQLIIPGVLPGYPGECDTVTRQLQQAYTAIFADTMIKPNTNDPKGRLHIPLGVEIVQTTHQSPDNFTRRFIIYDYRITNISSHPIEKMWCGIFLDNDCFYENVSGCPEGRAEDDIGGILTTWPNPTNPIYSDSLMVAWAMDNDGDACGSSRFPLVSARGCMGVRILRGPTPNSRVNFNWFTTNFGNIDWGPRLSTDQYVYGTGGTGLPPGDAGAYAMMSNGEIDYSQPFAALDFSPEWQRPLANASAGENVANGLDSRVCLSTGPEPLLMPGESVPFTVAFIGGANVHRIPTNVIDPQNPQEFIDKLDFSDLATNAWWAGYVWDNYGFDTDHDGNAGAFYFPPIAGDTIYYTGDGCPDLTGPPPPPSPDTANADLRVLSRPGELTLKWSGRTVETNNDRVLGTVNFEGYRVYMCERNSSKVRPSEDDYSLIASWDRTDFLRYTYFPGTDEESGSWSVDSYPLTNDQWREEFNDPAFNATDHSGPSLTHCYQYTTYDTLGVPSVHCAYFVPQDVNHGNEYMASGEIEQNKIQRVAVRDTVIDDITYQYGEYELRLTGLLQSKHYFLTLTAFDFGDPFKGRESLESIAGGQGNTRIGLPVYSADIVSLYDSLGGAFADSVRVGVYPNPYKASFLDASGERTSYYDQGFETIEGSKFTEKDRRIHFINVPDSCEINIYTLDGDLVRTLTHPDDVLSGYSSKVSWDLISRNQQAVTSGIYLYRVSSRLGSQVGKLVIIK